MNEQCSEVLVDSGVNEALVCDDSNLRDFAVALGSIWLRGNTAVPLCPSHPISEWRYVLTDSNVQQILVDQTLYDKV